MAPFVSFILPAYKREFLEAAIRSIVGQTYANFELIIVNDASPHGLREIVDLFSDSRISYHENKQNLGGTNLTDSWNYALTLAKGEYIVLASDDDVYDPEYLRAMVNLVNKYPEVDLYHCRLRYIDEKSEFKMFSQPAAEYESCADFISQRLFHYRKQTAPEFMFRREAMKKLGGFISFPLAWYSDDATWNALSVHGVAYESRALVSFRMSGLNLSTASLKNAEKIEALYQYKKWMQDFLYSINPETEDDMIILHRCRSEFVNVLNSHIFMYLPFLPHGVFFKTIWCAYKNDIISIRVLIRSIFRKFFF